MLGIALDFIKPSFEMNSLVEKHNSGELLCNMGELSEGYLLVVSSMDDIHQIRVKDSKKFDTHLPGTHYVAVSTTSRRGKGYKPQLKCVALSPGCGCKRLLSVVKSCRDLSK